MCYAAAPHTPLKLGVMNYGKNMRNNLQKAIVQFISEAKLIEGAEDAVFKLSDEIDNCIILSGKIFGKDTNDKINELGKKWLYPDLATVKIA